MRVSSKRLKALKLKEKEKRKMRNYIVLNNYLIIYQDKNGLGVFKCIHQSESEATALKEFKKDNTCYDVLSIREVKTNDVMSKSITL